MKTKVLSIFLVGIIIIGLTGCGNTESKKSTTSKDTEAITIVKNKNCIVRTKDTGYIMNDAINEVMKDVSWEEIEKGNNKILKITGVEKTTESRIELSFKVSSSGEVVKNSILVDGKSNSSYYDYNLFKSLLE